ncbi:MAG: replication-associated recombination protein A [Syntrophales bacterium]|nr:replication-associated recombination protein A [Syntrophales bacterium]MDD4338191.1 replication-associated recombination protein A [Syntrophales bacterium]HOG07931.1 replication-associated recombination protein A [Syntrophales bacterium]HOS77427.1 replication-associated recombination protein A [Syntrophales bacterium]HQN25524.1 replication-associated recombination protein A [Syntrophales bacterium]
MTLPVSDNDPRPLAERMRPRTLDEFVGQSHLLGEGSLLRRAIAEDRLFSIIFWGGPGCGKTTLARILAGETRSHFVSFSAVLSGVKEIRAVVEGAERRQREARLTTVLFVDEIHRFNKAQQDAFLPHVESGLITLIGATTENPSFEVIAPLLSRTRVLVLKPFAEEELLLILERALSDRERGLGTLELGIEPEALAHLAWAADGDARAALNSLEAAVSLVQTGSDGTRRITRANVEEALQKKLLQYDKGGEEHYNLISALHKSLRGSDPDATLYWLGRMLEAGEDPLYIARRMIRFASEDVGNADPRALAVAMDAMQAFHFLGRPEGELALAQAAVYLATAPKSNALYAGYGQVRRAIERTGTLPVPLHIRNAPTRLMKDLGYGRDYKYAHDYEDAYIPQDYLPDPLAGERFYRPTDRGFEKIIGERMAYWRGIREKHKKKEG